LRQRTKHDRLRLKFHNLDPGLIRLDNQWPANETTFVYYSGWMSMQHGRSEKCVARKKQAAAHSQAALSKLFSKLVSRKEYMEFNNASRDGFLSEIPALARGRDPNVPKKRLLKLRLTPKRTHRSTQNLRITGTGLLENSGHQNLYHWCHWVTSYSIAQFWAALS
jgi:hypothetical protein